MFEYMKRMVKYLDWYELPFVALMAGLTIIAMIREFNVWQATTLCWVIAAFLHRCTGAFYENAVNKLLVVNHQQSALLTELIDKVKQATEP